MNKIYSNNEAERTHSVHSCKKNPKRKLPGRQDKLSGMRMHVSMSANRF